MNKQVLMKRSKGWLALMLAVIMLWGNSMTVFAAEDIFLINPELGGTSNPDMVGGIREGQILDKGVRIKWLKCIENPRPMENMEAFNEVTILLNGVKQTHTDDNEREAHYTLPEDSETYTVIAVVWEPDSRVVLIELVSSENLENDNRTNASDDSKESHEHNWEWKKTQDATDTRDGEEQLYCTICGARGESRAIANSSCGTFCNMTSDKINYALENAIVEIETNIWSAMPKSVIEALKARRDVTVKMTLTYQNQKYPLLIPAGYDMSVLEEADWYGVLYLNQFFGVVEE